MPVPAPPGAGGFLGLRRDGCDLDGALDVVLARFLSLAFDGQNASGLRNTAPVPPASGNLPKLGKFLPRDPHPLRDMVGPLGNRQASASTARTSAGM